VNPLRWAWAWLRFLGREKPPWYYGVDEISWSPEDLSLRRKQIGP
jgi:hypothetical protein